MSSATEAVVKENTSKKRKKEFRKKNSSELLNEKNNSLKIPSKRSRNEEANEVKRKDLPKLKKKVVSQIKELQEILQTTKPPDENEKKLEGLVFGHTSEEFLEEEDMCCEDLDDDYDDEVPIEEVKDAEKKQRLAAWEDDDDETLLVKEKASQFKNCHRSVSLRGDEKYSNFVQEKFLKEMGGTPKWAEQNSDLDDSNDDSEDELLQKTGNFVIQEQSLPKGHINIRKTPSLVDPNMRKSMIKTCEFHPTSKVAAIAATNGILESCFKLMEKLMRRYNL
ncbi:u3 small nucleolar RNA-associated protein 18 [Caerostris extrusa]|uniref:U3 small nucleolar RNA-associated protein 18 n=1 Tax=Caerostris extrusa TaxID=172846 RepID=A0AAV4MU84_CAEEX|nr:u3 small nucleolar RNA-associated protein 18 [Caerostris extrusa]